MQKWRTYYPLIKIKENEAGITLVELLAAISILSIVILLAGSVHMFGQRQFIDQTKSASQENDISYAMTVMSTDLRKLSKGEINKLADSSIETDRYSYKFNLEKKQLEKGDTILVEGVTGSFTKLLKEEKIEGVQITISSGNSKEFKTTIYFRR